MSTFDPRYQWGDYVLIDHPHAAEQVKAEAKERLMESMQAFIPAEYRSEVVWLENDDLATFDPETGEYYHTTSIAWKWTPRR